MNCKYGLKVRSRLKLARLIRQRRQQFHRRKPNFDKIMQTNFNEEKSSGIANLKDRKRGAKYKMNEAMFH